MVHISRYRLSWHTKKVRDMSSKQELIKEFGSGDKDSGKAEVQVAILTERINDLREHFSDHKKPYRKGVWEDCL